MLSAVRVLKTFRAEKTRRSGGGVGWSRPGTGTGRASRFRCAAPGHRLSRSEIIMIDKYKRNTVYAYAMYYYYGPLLG